MDALDWLFVVGAIVSTVLVVVILVFGAGILFAAAEIVVDRFLVWIGGN